MSLPDPVSFVLSTAPESNDWRNVRRELYFWDFERGPPVGNFIFFHWLKGFGRTFYLFYIVHSTTLSNERLCRAQMGLCILRWESIPGLDCPHGDIGIGSHHHVLSYNKERVNLSMLLLPKLLCTKIWGMKRNYREFSLHFVLQSKLFSMISI